MSPDRGRAPGAAPIRAHTPLSRLARLPNASQKVRPTIPAITDARTALGDLLLGTRDLAIALDAAEQVQWSPAPRPRPDTDASRKPSGPPSDPTAAVALQDERLEVRAACAQARQAMAAALSTVTAARARVSGALAFWEGGPSPSTAPMPFA